MYTIEQTRQAIRWDIPSYAVMGLCGCYSVAREFAEFGVCLEWVARCEGLDIGHALTKAHAEEICKEYARMDIV